MARITIVLETDASPLEVTKEDVHDCLNELMEDDALYQIEE